MSSTAASNSVSTAKGRTHGESSSRDLNPQWGYVAGLGQASIDFLGQAPEYPARDSKCELSDLTIQGGGPTATALVTLSRLGMAAVFIGAVGDDKFGEIIRQGLVDEGVDVSNLRMIPGALSQYAFIAIDESGGRTIFWHRGFGTDLSAESIDLNVVRQAGLLHMDGLKTEASLAAARAAKDAGVHVVFDAGTLRNGYMELVKLTDYLICSERFFHAFRPDRNIEQGLPELKKLGPRQVVVTMGEKGAHGFNGTEFYHQPAYDVEVVDTTGAGDVYHGAYIFGILNDWNMRDCMRFSSAVAAMKCRSVGGRTGIPDIESVKDFMGDGYPG